MAGSSIGKGVNYFGLINRNNECWFRITEQSVVAVETSLTIRFSGFQKPENQCVQEFCSGTYCTVCGKFKTKICQLSMEVSCSQVKIYWNFIEHVPWETQGI
jgi:hypothetical protein